MLLTFEECGMPPSLATIRQPLSVKKLLGGPISRRGALDPMDRMEWEFFDRTHVQLDFDDASQEVRLVRQENFIPNEIWQSPTLLGYQLFEEVLKIIPLAVSIDVKYKFDLLLDKIFSISETSLAFAFGYFKDSVLVEAWHKNAAAILSDRFSAAASGYLIQDITIAELQRVGLLAGYSPLQAVISINNIDGRVVALLTGCCESDFETPYLIRFE